MSAPSFFRPGAAWKYLGPRHPPYAGHNRTPNEAEILLRRAVGYDIRTYGCVGSGPQTQGSAFGRGPPNAESCVGDPATFWTMSRRFGASDRAANRNRRPLCSVSCYARAPGGEGRNSYLSRVYTVCSLMAGHVAIPERRWPGTHLAPWGHTDPAQARRAAVRPPLRMGVGPGEYRNNTSR